MSAPIEDLVRAAQREQAHRAVDPQRILAALPRRRAQLVRRRRLTVAAVAAAAVAAALAVPVISLNNRGAGPPPQPAVTPSPSVSVSPTPSAAVALRYRPTWLPEGYAEYFRSSRLDGTSRIWSPDEPAGPLLDDMRIFFLNVGEAAGAGAAPPADGDQEVEIGDARGVYRPDGQLITWPAGGFTLTLGVSNTTLSKATLLRIARSVRPDRDAFRLPFRPPALPPGLYQVSQSVSGAGPDDWVGEISLGDDPQVPAGDVEITVGTATPAPKGGTDLRVGDRPARYVKSPRRGWFLVVDLGAGRTLTVLAIDLPQAEMIKLAAGTGPLTTEKMPWIGSR